MAINSTVLPDRHTKLLELLPKHNWKVAPAAIEAGFSPKSADKRGKSLLQTALKRQQAAMQSRREELATSSEGTKAITNELKKQTIAEKLGMSWEQVRNNIVWLAEQERDLATRYKVVKAIAKDEGVDLSEDESSKVTVPVLNVTMEAPNKAIQSGITRTIDIVSGNADCATQEVEGDTGGSTAPETTEA